MSTRTPYLLTTATVFLLAAANALWAQGDGLSAQDMAFIQAAARAGMAEIRLGQLAQERASSQAVQALAQRMAEDSTRSNRELADIAQRKGVILPPDDEGVFAGSLIAQTKGAEFDRIFPEVVIADHVKAIANFEQAANNGSDLDVKNWAAKNLLTLRTHLADAKALPK
jgi:putative membrane protein